MDPRYRDRFVRVVLRERDLRDSGLFINSCPGDASMAQQQVVKLRSRLIVKSNH